MVVWKKVRIVLEGEDLLTKHPQIFCFLGLYICVFCSFHGMPFWSGCEDGTKRYVDKR